MKHVASLHYGVIFKKAFSQPDIFMGFVKDILGVEINIDHVETEKSFDKPIGSVDSRFDLFAEDTVNRVIVDIQHRRFPDHYHRFLNYHCAALLQQVVNSKDYRPALQVYTIVVLTGGDQHKRDISLIDFDPKDRHGVGLGEIKHKVIYLCPKYVTEETPEPWREWLLAINDSLDEEVEESNYHNALVQKIFTSIEHDHLTPSERARMKDEYSESLLQAEEWKEAAEEVRQHSLAEGQLIAQRATALRALAAGMTIEMAAQLVGLSVEVVKEWA